MTIFRRKIHNLVFLAHKTKLTLSEDDPIFLDKMNEVQLEGRYPDYIKNIYKIYKLKQTTLILKETDRIRKMSTNKQKHVKNKSGLTEQAKPKFSSALKRVFTFGSITIICGLVISLRQCQIAQKAENDTRKEKIEVKIKEYKGVLELVDKLSYLSNTWAIDTFKVKKMNVYPTLGDYEELYTNGRGIMDLLKNVDELILNDSIKEQWSFSYYMFDKYFKMKESMANILKGIPVAPNFQSQSDSIMRLNNYMGYYWTDSFSAVLQKSLRNYASKQIDSLNLELKKIDPIWR